MYIHALCIKRLFTRVHTRGYHNSQLIRGIKLSITTLHTFESSNHSDKKREKKKNKKCARERRSKLSFEWKNLQTVKDQVQCVLVLTPQSGRRRCLSPSGLGEVLLSLNSRARPARGPIRESRKPISGSTIAWHDDVGQIYGSFFVIPASTAISPPFSSSSEPETRRHRL